VGPGTEPKIRYLFSNQVGLTFLLLWRHQGDCLLNILPQHAFGCLNDGHSKGRNLKNRIKFTINLGYSKYITLCVMLLSGMETPDEGYHPLQCHLFYLKHYFIGAFSL
jgi:hypothetical protein